MRINLSAKFINGNEGTIYLVTNTKNGKQYVGQTTYALKERWRHHLYTRSEDPHNGSLSSDIEKFGESKFALVVLCRTEQLEQLDDLEKFYIKEYETLFPNGYNLTTGGLTFSPKEWQRERLARYRTRLSFTDNPKPLQNTSKPRTRRNKKRLVDRYKPVIGTHMETGEVIELPFLSADSRFDPRLISACCHGKRRFHRQFAWRFKNEQ